MVRLVLTNGEESRWEYKNLNCEESIPLRHPTRGKCSHSMLQYGSFSDYSAIVIDIVYISISHSVRLASSTS